MPNYSTLVRNVLLQVEPVYRLCDDSVLLVFRYLLDSLIIDNLVGHKILQLVKEMCLIQHTGYKDLLLSRHPKSFLNIVNGGQHDHVTWSQEFPGFLLHAFGFERPGTLGRRTLANN